MKDETWDKLTRLWGGKLEYCEPQTKKDAHNVAKRVLRHFAKEILGLAQGTFDVRSNPAGIAVSGEVTLHTDPPPNCEKGYYLQIGHSCLGPGATILFRTCKNRTDYTGDRNCFHHIACLGGPLAAREFGLGLRLQVEPLE